MKASNGSLTLRPKKIFCFQSINDILSRFLKRPDFASKCEEWRNRQPDPNTLSDVYDGNVWKSFNNSDGNWFFKNPFTYGCSINLDWFQPYENTQYSVGVLYLCMLNLPPEERCKVNNIGIIGILPGPHEPSENINSYLKPAVEELQELYKGVWINVQDMYEKRFCSLAVLCATCDIPAPESLLDLLVSLVT